ncbi:fumarate reductase cytochrome b subunit [Paraferrimonas haliotis]|uniref:Fumarate reductase n=1 Tax=Paraferrimonas haliotis TaxID=2013866 RepID=A0AA37TKZ7_9GAMM|nr:fumarate reductase cytochrome b subunit [Paraferrimonas haliotis]GLS83437.1 fumarate reductase [Paraferrimonas haliotis]
MKPQLPVGPNQARIDLLQSVTGALMALFLIVHIHFESSILLGKDAFFAVVQILEGGLFTDDGLGRMWVTRVFSGFMLLLFIAHAAAALRRFPTRYRHWKALRQQMSVVKHGDTQLWFWQMLTGFLLFFLVSVHLFTMLLNPEIGPHYSAARVVHEHAWLLYLLLLPAVVFHAMIGLYRVALKWGVVANRSRAKKVALFMCAYLMLMGLASLLGYVAIGLDLPLNFEPFGPAH